MNTVYLRGRSRGGPLHSLYKELVKFPPSGYQFVTAIPEIVKNQQLEFNLYKKIDGIPFARDVWREVKTLQYMGIRRFQAIRTGLEYNADLVYASQQLMFIKVPWVADFEYANALVNYGDIRLCRRFIQKAVASKHCKKILPWSNWAKRTLYRSIDCSSFKEKIETVHFGMPPKKIVKKKNDGKLRLLFVGSINLLNFLNFEWKGGFDVVEAFVELNKKYEGLELMIRSWVPPDVKKKYAKNPNIKIIYSPLSEEELALLYSSSDIFMFPSYLNLGMVILEAMSYELPVVAPRLYDVPEAVQDMKTGVLVENHPKLPLYAWNGTPNHHDKSLLLQIRHYRPWRVKQIVEKTSLLIEDDSLRRRIGREARHLIEHGEFSIKKRNEKLKKIFDMATEK